jgi:lipoic acid synthetase
MNKMEQGSAARPQRRPPWIKVRAPTGEAYRDLKRFMRTQSLHTVCEEAHCPNIGECWAHRTATFLILGDTCTRNCRFCNIATGRPAPPDPDEPLRVAQTVQAMGLKHAVVTSVDRDDLSDGGASAFAAVIRQIRQLQPGCTVEVLIPDFRGRVEPLRAVVDARPDVLNHNVETVKRLFSAVQPQCRYAWSLDVLRNAKVLWSEATTGKSPETSPPTVAEEANQAEISGKQSSAGFFLKKPRRGAPGFFTKSGLMVGLGETVDEVLDVMRSLRELDVDILTIGQYLQPTKTHVPIARYYTPDEFDMFRRRGEEMGFKWVESGPLVRSSYHAEAQVEGLCRGV